MKRIAESIVLMALGSVVMTGCSGSRIDGTYSLVERRLPDGTVQTPPEIIGSAVFADGVRNVIVHSKDDVGRNVTTASAAEFDLQQYSYTETNVFFMTNDGGLLYEVDKIAATEEVVYTKAGVRFKMPLRHDDPLLEFSEHGFTATRAGQFIDHWKKVDVIRTQDRKAREAEERAAREAAETAAREEAGRKAAEEAAARQAAEAAASTPAEPQK